MPGQCGSGVGGRSLIRFGSKRIYMRTGICGEAGARSNISKGLVGDSDEGGRLMPYVGLPVWGFDPYAKVTYGSLESWGFDPYARYAYTAPDRGLLAVNQPEIPAASTVPGTAGRMDFAKVRLPTASLVTNVVMFVATVGVALTANQCIAGLWDSAGNKIGVTADQSAAWVSTGPKVMALTGGPFALPAGNYYVGFWYNGTTSPAWARSVNVLSSLANLGFSAPNLLFGTADTGLTTAASAPTTMGAQTGTGVGWWVALS